MTWWLRWWFSDRSTQTGNTPCFQLLPPEVMKLSASSFCCRWPHWPGSGSDSTASLSSWVPKTCGIPIPCCTSCWPPSLNWTPWSSFSTYIRSTASWSARLEVGNTCRGPQALGILLLLLLSSSFFFYMIIARNVSYAYAQSVVLPWQVVCPCPSVCLLTTMRYCDHISWNTTELSRDPLVFFSKYWLPLTRQLCWPSWPLYFAACRRFDLSSSFSFFLRLISEVAWSIVIKLCHMFNSDQWNLV